MAKTKVEADENGKYPHDDQFPANVNPTEENRKQFSEQMQADRDALKDGEHKDAGKTVERVGEGLREIPTNEAEPEASPSGKSQTKTVSK